MTNTLNIRNLINEKINQLWERLTIESLECHIMAVRIQRGWKSRTISDKDPSFNQHRFKYKIHMFIYDKEGGLIKEKKYSTCKSCSDDNKKLLRNYQVVTRIANKYKFSKNFNDYNNIVINKINEKRKSKLTYTRVLAE
jgi:hypothetical protein